MGITGAAEVLVFITAIVGLAVISLQKQPGGAGTTGWEGDSPALLPAPPGGSTNRATRASEPLARQIR